MKKLILGFFVLIVLISFISATETQISVKTMPFHDVQLALFDPYSNDFILYERFVGNSNNYGDISFNFSSDKQKFRIISFIKKDNVKILTKQFDDIFVAGEPIYLEIVQEGFEIIPTPIQQINYSNNQTSKNTTNESNLREETNSEETNTNKSQLTGLVTSEKSSIFSKKTVYYTGGIIGFFIASFIVFLFIKNKQSSAKEITIKKLSELKEDKGDKIGYDLRLIEDAERKIKEAQEEINKLKNKERIKELKNKVENYQKEINKLEEGS